MHTVCTISTYQVAFFRVSSGLGVGAALSEPHSVWGYGSKGWCSVVDAGEGCDENCMNVKMMGGGRCE